MKTVRNCPVAIKKMIRVASCVPMDVFELQRKLDIAGVPRCWYHLDGLPVPYCFEGETMLKREQGNDGKTMWVYYVLLDRRVKTDVHCFDEETEALEYMYAKLTTSWEKYKTYYESNRRFAKSYEDKEISRLLNRIHRKPVSGKHIFRYGFKTIPLINDTYTLETQINVLLKDGECSVENTVKPNNEKYYRIVGRRFEITLDEMNGKWMVMNIHRGIIAKHFNFSELDSEADACTAFYYFLRKQYWP